MALLADDVDLGRDRDLVQRFQNGDPDAFDDLYRRYFARLRRYCLRHTRDAIEAEEVAQEAFVRALRSMHTLSGERRFYPWLTVIAKRITIDHHRKHSRVDLTDDPEVGSVDPDVEHLFAEVDAGHVREAMSRVGPRHREVLLLRETEGMSYARIAEHLDVPVTTVEALLHRARKALRREYSAVGGERRGVYGLPLVAWLSTRFGGLRTAVNERWVELGAVLAPVAVGAATAAVMLIPADTAPTTRVETAAVERAAVPATAAPTPSADGPVLVAPGGPVETRSTAREPSSTTVPPTVDAGPVDVFVGPEGTEQARTAAEAMPLHPAVGPATGGADASATAEDLHTFVAGAVAVVFGTADDSDTRQPTTVHDLLGGNP